MPLPIPEPRDQGYTTQTSAPLYWAAYGPLGAPRLLVLHGGPGADHRYLLPQMLRLTDRHDVLFYDQRGGGRSTILTTDRTPITAHTQVDDLANVIAERWGQERPVIVGYSWGGVLAMLYATDEHVRVPPNRLVLIDPAGVNRQYREAFETEFARRQAAPPIVAARATLASSGLRDRDPEAYRQRSFELSVAGYFADPAMARDLTPFRVAGRVQQSVWESLGDYDLVPALRAARGRLGMPVLIVHGREDPFPVASSEALAAAIGGQLDVIENCGHVPYVEQPDELFEAIDQFLGSEA